LAGTVSVKDVASLSFCNSRKNLLDKIGFRPYDELNCRKINLNFYAFLPIGIHRQR
jgi:hypothetical protein